MIPNRHCLPILSWQMRRSFCSRWEASAAPEVVGEVHLQCHRVAASLEEAGEAHLESHLPVVEVAVEPPPSLFLQLFSPSCLSFV